MSAGRVKFLIVGSVRGQFKRLYESVVRANRRHGPFAALVCLGDFFADDAQDEMPGGMDAAPILTYHTDQRTRPVPPNVISLTPGIVTTHAHVHILYCDAAATPVPPIDFLLTPALDEASRQLEAAIAPRYHFAAIAEGAPMISEPPRRNDTASAYRFSTRSLGLPPAFNADHTRFWCGLQITPAERMATGTWIEPGAAPKDDAPTRSGQTRGPTPATAAAFPHRPDSKMAASHPLAKRAQEMAPDTSCWFCLSKPTVEREYIFSIAEHVYLAAAKGGLTPDHLLIVPIEHIRALNEAPEGVRREIQRYRAALEACFADRVLVYWERAAAAPASHVRAVPAHALLQAIPLDPVQVARVVVQARKLADDAGFEAIATTTQAGPGQPYLHLQVGEFELAAVMKPRVSAQAARELVARAIGRPERANWRDCQGKDWVGEDTRAVSLSTRFRAFDWSLKESEDDGGCK